MTLRDVGDAMYGTEEELNRSISLMDPDTVAEKDYIDDDTGEIVLSGGEPARNSRLHPQYQIDVAKERAAKTAALDAEIANYAREDEEEREVAQSELDKAIEEFVEDVDKLPLGADVSGVVPDIVDAFFYQYRWQRWAQVLDMSKDEIKSILSDMVYEKMMRD